MRPIILLTFILCFAFAANGQAVQQGFDLSNYGVKIEADKRLIVVLAALEMAETKTDSGTSEKLINTPLSDKGAKFRAQLLQDNAGLDADLRRRISSFVAQYKKRHPQWNDAELVAPFMSMAFTLTPAPELADPVITTDLPGNLLDVLDFAPLAREFYRRSGIAAKLDDYAKTYARESDGVLRTSSREMVSELLDYLHTRPQLFATEKSKVETTRSNSKKKIEKVETRTHERHFVIVPEMLAPQGNINFLNARDDYYVVLPPDKDLSFSGVRRAFLQFVIDPLVLSSTKEITALSDWAKQRLDETRKTNPNVSPDVILTISRSLAAAVDVRQEEFTRVRIATDQARRRIDALKTDTEKRAVSAELEKFKQSLADENTLKLAEEYDSGLVLVFFFADKLKDVEDSGFDIAASLKEMLATFDPAKETARLAGTADARKRALAAREERKAHPETRPTVVENPVTAKLRDIQRTIDAKDYTKAASDLKQLQAQNPSEPRIYYNIGRVTGLAAASIEDEDLQAAKLIEAKEAYTKVLTTATPDTDKALLSLTYVALARIYEHFNKPDEAIKLYDQALKFGRIGAFQEAMTGKQRLLNPQK
jgi:tetratricopeptide (TPR) repeat protein